MPDAEGVYWNTTSPNIVMDERLLETAWQCHK
jgi:hypothetical protein